DGVLMVRTGGSRGHGAGTAKTQALEQERRAKIRTAALLRKKQVRVEITARYRLRNRPEVNHGGSWNRKKGITYSDHTYRIRISPADFDNPERVKRLLDQRNPARMHYQITQLEFTEKVR